jgi:hypothetical protein
MFLFFWFFGPLADYSKLTPQERQSLGRGMRKIWRWSLFIATVFLLILNTFPPLRGGDVAAIKITGAAATVPISTVSTNVRWVQLVTPSGNAANVLWGSCAVTSSTNGSIIPAGAGQFLPPTPQGGYDLAQVCVYVAMSDIVYVSWDKF